MFGIGGDDWLVERLIWILPLLLSLSVHEWAHARAAFQLGDDTAMRLGRMTLNPLAHIDPVGTLLLPLLGIPFGWAKPVPIEPLRFFKQVSLRSGVALTAAAGPLSNVALAGASLMALALAASIDPALVETGATARRLLESLVLLNVLLACFNMLPFPPLDGSRVVDAVVPPRLAPLWRQIHSVGPMALVVVIAAPLLLGVSIFSVPIAWARSLVALALAVDT
jgi:Zn-dependent protease